MIAYPMCIDLDSPILAKSLSRRLLRLRKSLQNEAEAAKINNLLLSALIISFVEKRFPKLLDVLEQHSSAALFISQLQQLDAIFKLELRNSLQINTVPALLLDKLQEIKSISEQCSLTSICYLSEKLLADGNPNREGVYYTPLVIVDQIVADTLTHCRNKLRAPSILDPACGSGVFLVRSFEKLAKDLSHEQRCKILSAQIFGVDKDRRAVELCKLLLLLSLLDSEQRELFPSEQLPNLNTNIICGNSLLASNDLGSFESEQAVRLGALNWQETFAQVFEKGGFDCVIGNPPYGLSRDQQLDPLENEILKSSFSEFRTGKLNKYLAFMARGFQLLCEGGELSFIVPNSWLGIEGGFAMRQTLLSGGALRRLVVFDCQVFDEPSLEAVVFAASKGTRHETLQIFRTSSLKELPKQPSVVLPISECLRTEQSRISIRWSEDNAALLRQIEAVSWPLNSIQAGFNPMIALQAYARGKGAPPQDELAAKSRIFHTDSKEDQNCLPYLEGADLSAYCLSWSGNYLRYGKWLAEPQTLERFSGPRILIREILNPLPYCLVACLTQDVFLYNKSVLHILPNTEVKLDQLWALLALLNSKLASFWITQRGRKSQRKLFPKLVNADLKDFPVSKKLLEEPVKLAELARKISAHDGLLPGLRQEIDQLIFSAYQLKNSQVQLIEKECELV